MKKVLIITYYWPPAGTSAVFRWLKFVKYLRQFNWEPIVYTVENGEFPEIDEKNAQDIPEGVTVLKHPIWEPYNIYKTFIGQKKSEKVNVGFLSEKKKPAFQERLSVWVRGNFFIPDARCFWINPSAKYLSKYLSENKVDLIVSSGPPHSTHLIAQKLKKRFKLPWIADFRDPWTNIDFYEDLHLTFIANNIHHRLEKKVVRTADCTITVGNKMTEEFHAMKAKRVETITNGFDIDLNSNEEINLDKKFNIAHFGTVNKARNPYVLWNAIKELVLENKSFANDLQISFIGRVDQSIQESVEQAGLEKYVTRIAFVPHHEVMKMQMQSQVLLLLINQSKNAEGILTGKFFEYLAAQRPILAIGPKKGDVADILSKTNAGDMVDFNDKDNLKAVLLKFYDLYKQGNLNVLPSNIQAYSRFELTRKLSGIMNELTQ
jgi:hypothetical protein